MTTSLLSLYDDNIDLRRHRLTNLRHRLDLPNRRNVQRLRLNDQIFTIAK